MNTHRSHLSVGTIGNRRFGLAATLLGAAAFSSYGGYDNYGYVPNYFGTSPKPEPPQSEEDKEFYLKRAQERREQKKARQDHRKYLADMGKDEAARKAAPPYEQWPTCPSCAQQDSLKLKTTMESNRHGYRCRWCYCQTDRTGKMLFDPKHPNPEKPYGQF